MPTVFRSMKAAADGFPIVGDQAKELGVRVPPNPHADIDVDSTSNLVVWNGKGMSVVENWRLLAPHLIPVRLSAVVPKAKGLGNLRCYRLGDGAFASGFVADGLKLVLKSGSTMTGNIVPITSVTVAEFQSDLATTRTLWVEDET